MVGSRRRLIRTVAATALVAGSIVLAQAPAEATVTAFVDSGQLIIVSDGASDTIVVGAEQVSADPPEYLVIVNGGTVESAGNSASTWEVGEVIAELGGGNDSFSMDGEHYPSLGTYNVKGQSGDDTIEIRGPDNQTFNVRGGRDNDHLMIQGGDNHTLLGGGGTDNKLTLMGTDSIDLVSLDGPTITTAASTFTAKKFQRFTFDAGADVDVLDVLQNPPARDVIMDGGTDISTLGIGEEDGNAHLVRGKLELKGDDETKLLVDGSLAPGPLAIALKDVAGGGNLWQARFGDGLLRALLPEKTEIDAELTPFPDSFIFRPLPGSSRTFVAGPTPFLPSPLMLTTLDGNDVVDAADYTRRTTLDLGEGADTGIGGSKNDQFFGGLGKDTLRGRGGDDTLDGGDDIDKCYGGPGADAFTSCEQEEQG